MCVKKNITRYSMILAGLLILMANLKPFDHSLVKIEKNIESLNSSDDKTCEIFEYVSSNYSYNIIRLTHAKNVYTKINEGNNTLYKFSIRETIKGGSTINIKSNNDYFNFVFNYYDNIGIHESMISNSNYKSLKVINNSTKPLGTNEFFLRSHSDSEGKSICIILDGIEEYNYIHITRNIVFFSFVLTITIFLLYCMIRNFNFVKIPTNTLKNINTRYLNILFILLLLGLSMVNDFKLSSISKNFILFCTFIIIIQFNIKIILKKINYIYILLLLIVYFIILLLRTDLSFVVDFLTALIIIIIYKLHYDKPINNSKFK